MPEARKMLLLTALCGSYAAAQYIHGDEKPLRPEAPAADAVQTTMSLSQYQALQRATKQQAKPETAQAAPPQPATAEPEESVARQALLPAEKLTPPEKRFRTVIVEHAVYRCESGNGLVFVDEDNKKKFGKCTLFRAEKTAEIPLEPVRTESPAGNDNGCSGTLRYHGNNYTFDAREPCPIPGEVFLKRLPDNPSS